MEESKASLEVDSATIPPPNEGVVDIQDGSASYSEDSLTTPNQNIINTSSLPAYCVQPRELAPKKFSTCPPSLATDLKKKSSTSQSGEESISEHIPSYEETQSASLNIGHDASGRSYEIREDSEHAKSPEQCLHSTEKKSDNKKSPEGSKQDSSISEYDPSRPESKQNSSKADVSWPKTIDKLDVVHISNESSILTLFESSAQSQSRKFDNIVHKHTVSEPDEYPDSLTYGPSHTVVIESPSKKDTSSSSSEEIIKLDIRGQAAPKFYTLPAERFIIGPQPKIDSSSYITIAENETTEPKITNLMSQFALGPISESNNEKQNLPVDNIERSSDDIQEELFYDSINAGQTKNEEADCLIEELVVENTVENESLQKDLDMEHVSFHTQSKSFLDQETPSLSTMTTDYKTICEEYHGKLVQFEAAMSKKEDLIKDLTISLQQSLTIREELQFDNKHLTSELGKLQMLLTESLAPDNGNVQGQLSDYMKYEGLVKGEDTRYFSAFMSREKSFDRSSQRGSSNSEKDIDVEEMTIDFSKSSPKSTDDIPTLPEMEAKLSSLVNELHEYITKDGVGTLSSLKDKIITLCQAEIEKIRQVAETEYKVLQKQHTADKQAHNTEAGKMRALLSSVKTGNANLSEMRDELNVSHEKEMENLRTYYEKICSDMKKNYSEEVFSQHSLQQLSPGSSADSLDRCPAALPFGSPLHSGGGDRLHRRSKSVDFQAQAVEIAQLEVKIKQLNQQYQQQMDALKPEHVAYVNDLVSRHKEAIIEMDEAFKDQIAELKAHIQTAENTEETAIDPNATINIYDEDIDLELEKGVQANMFEEKLHEAKQDVILHMQEQIQALLSDPNADLNSWPLDLVALRDKLHTDAQQTIHHMKIMHEEELSSLRAEHARQLTSVAEEGPTCGLHAAEHWRRRRNDSFDENRRLEEITKQRDGFKERTGTLQRLVQLLVNYLEQCEDEVNNTILEELLKLPVAAGVNLDITNVGSEELDSRNPSLNTSLMSVNINAEADPNMSVISTSKRVHFAPDVQGFLSQLNDESMINCLEQEKNLSVEIKHELDVSLQRLRQEAQELLALSVKVSANRAPTSHADEKGAEELHQCNGDEMRRLVEEMETTKRDCDVCEMEKKQLEETISESLHRELLLREQLEQAMVRIDNLMTDEEHNNSREIITEGYGTALPPRTPVSLPPPSRMPVVSPPAIIVESRSVSLDGSTTSAIRRAIDVTRLAAELETVVRARDDLEMQLEAANRQLKSTRQFVEEQTSEREHERDEYACELKQLRDENSKLLNKLQHNGRIRSEVDQLEAHMREMTLALTELEAKKSESEAAVVASGEKISVLQDVIADLEGQLEFKATSETDILAELGEMRKTIDLRDSKMRELLQELESLKSEQAERTEMENVSGKDNSLIEAESSNKMMDQMREQLSSLEESIHKRTITLERIHEAVCSHSCSSPSEDVSIRDQKIKSASLGSSARDICVNDIPKMPILSSPTRTTPMAELSRLAEYLQHHFRAEDAALKRIRDLEMQLVQVKDVAQELRTERDVLQERMSEQTLKISSLQMRLDEQRHCAEALRQESNSQLAARLHDALAELQNARETLESKEKQISRLKALVEETKKRLGEREMNEIYVGNNAAGDPVAGLERDLQEAQSKNRELYQLAESIDITKTADIKQLKALLDEKERQLDDKEEQLQGLLALKLDDENAKDNSKTEKEADGGKISARTLSDIVSISEYDEQDLQMRRAELRPLTTNISGTPLSHHDHNKELNKTLPPEFTEKPQMRSLHLDHSSFNVEHLDLAEPSPRPFSAPLTGSPLVRGKSKVGKYKRNVNETLMFGTSIERLGLSGDDIKHSTAHGIPDNCSMYPNKDVDESKDNTVEPKKINFSIKSDDSAKKLEHKSLKDLGITIDSKQEQYPDILTQLKQEIFTLRAELEEKTSVLKEAEDQLSEFPTVNREMEELKNMLQSSITTMKQEKQFYETQLEDFSANKQLLEEQLASALNQANEKTKDLKLLKEDILRRENMVLELAKEKRALQNQLTEFEVKCQSLLDRNAALEACENENIQMREKLVELKKLEQLISEKNLQIDSLNEHLDRLDDLQRCLDDKTEEVEKLTDVIDEKAAEILQLQENERVTAAEIGKITENNRQLKVHNEEIVERLTKFEKEQENLKQKANMLSEKEKQLEKISTINSELTGKLEEMKSLTNKLNDKECEIEILNEDINSFHDEIASLKEQLKLASRSPSPRDAKVADERMKTPGDKQTVNDKKQLGKIRKQVSLLQSELNYNKKDLNERVFELERTKLEVIELRNELGHARKRAAEQEGVLTQALKEAEMLRARLQQVLSRLKEEANLEEIQEKLRAKTEDCAALERELELLRDALDRLRASTPTHGPLAILGPGDEVALIRSGQHSPTEELEERVRRELQYARQLDDTIMDQIFSGGSTSSRSERNLVEMVDDEEEVPPLELHTSRSNSSLRSSASERLVALQRENDQLRAQLLALETRLAEREALVGELAEDARAARLRLDAERDNSGRLQLLLETHRQSADDLQTQDVNVIQILRSRLEGAMETESDLQQALEKERLKVHQLQLQLSTLKRTSPTSPNNQQDQGNQLLKMQLENQVDANERLKSEIMLLKAKLDREKSKLSDTRSQQDKEKRWYQRELEARTDQCNTLRSELAELKRLKHEAGVELVHAREAVHVQKKEIANLEKRIAGLTDGSRGDAKPFQSILIEFEQQKGDLSKEITSLKKALELANQREMNLHQFLISSESSSKMTEALGVLKEEKAILKEEKVALKEEKAILQERIRLLEQELANLKGQKASETSKNQVEEYERGVRYLHACLLRVESYRKALIWQKRYLMRVLSGYVEVEQTYAPPTRSRTCKGKQRFRCIAFMVITVLRLGFLVRRRHNTKVFSANCLFGREDSEARKTPGIQISNSPPMRDKSHRSVFTPSSLLRQSSTTPTTAYKEWQRAPRTTPFRSKDLATEEKSREASYLWRSKNLEERSKEVMESQSPTPSAGSSCRNAELRRRTVGRSSRSSTSTFGDEGSHVRSSTTEQESKAVLTQLSRRLDHYSLKVSQTLDTHHHAP